MLRLGVKEKQNEANFRENTQRLKDARVLSCSYFPAFAYLEITHSHWPRQVHAARRRFHH